MTPEEKAIEIFGKHCYAIREEEDSEGYFTNIKHAKQSALITVNEILELIDDEQPGTNWNWWVRVKTKLENL